MILGLIYILYIYIYLNKLLLLSLLYYSPSARKGFLDFIRVVLLLLLRRLLPPPHPPPPLRSPDPSGHCRTSTASSRSQWALPNLDCEL